MSEPYLTPPQLRRGPGVVAAGLSIFCGCAPFGIWMLLVLTNDQTVRVFDWENRIRREAARG